MSAGAASLVVPSDGAHDRIRQAAIVCATWLPVAFMAYALLVWPLVFGSSEVDLSEQVLGWLVNPPPKNDSVLKQIPYPLFFLISSVCLALSGCYRRLPLRSPLVLILAAFVGLAIVSCAWSVFPADSFKRGVLCGLVMATLLFAVYTARDYGTIARGLFWTLFTAAILNVAAVFLKPPSPIGYTGIYPHKNFFGFVAALILYFGIHGFALGGWLYRSAAVLMLILAPPFLLASGSKTSAGLAGLAPLIALALCGLRRRTSMPPIVVVFIPIILLPLAYWIGREAGLWDFALLAETLLGSATLTGRTEIWAIAGDLISERPWLGWGYEAVWAMGADGEVTKRAVGFVRTMPTAHNGFIDIFTQLGIAGLTLLFSLIVLVFGILGKIIDTNPRLGWFYGTILIFVLLHNNLESDILISSNQLSMMLLLYTFIAFRTIDEGRQIETAPKLEVSHPSPPVLRQE